MEIVFATGAPAAWRGAALAAIVPEGKAAGRLAELDQALGGMLNELLERGEFTPHPFEALFVPRPAGLGAGRLLLMGAGAKPDMLRLRRLGAATARALKGRGLREIALLAPAEAGPEALRALAIGVAQGNFEPDFYRSDRKPERQIERLTLLVASVTPEVEAAGREAGILARALRFCCDLANEPGNRMTPTILGERAAAMAATAGLECERIGPERAAELGMGALLGVAQGSAEPPVLIVLRYFGDPAGREAAPKLAIIGKGVTFDTGGISIKPAERMEWMKFDMSGGAATLGAMQALAALRPACNLIALVPAVENMPGGRAQKPGDVCIAMSGKSIEVLNTDAEGRLILADALHYARTLGAKRLVDSATLTGACVVALGHVYSGVFANHEGFLKMFWRAQARSGEKMWRLPLDPDYSDLIKGSVGDILNTGGRWGGAITAAMFLEAFVGDTPWIHLDIAGTAYSEDNKPWMTKGPTGTPLLTLVELAQEAAAAEEG